LNPLAIAAYERVVIDRPEHLLEQSAIILPRAFLESNDASSPEMALELFNNLQPSSKETWVGEIEPA
jgi:hypothetical protein